jgi:hypothetical protein
MARAQGVNVTTYHNDNARTGRNISEKELSPATVGKATFGRKFRLGVDGDVYAQPLFLSGVPIGANKIDLVFVATQHDSVFAFDAKTGNRAWFKSFLTGTGVTTIAPTDIDPTYNDITPEIGITGTPVIRLNAADVSLSTLYVVAKTKETIDGKPSCVQRLHALSVVDGLERPNSPKLIASQPLGADLTGINTVSVDGQGTGITLPIHWGMPGDNANGKVRFFPLLQNQRSGLLLAGPAGAEAVYVCWGSHTDQEPFHGWIMGFDATTLDLKAVFNVTPNGGRAGIWGAGAAPAADQNGFIYFSTGNGTFDSQLNRTMFPSRNNFGDSVLKLRVDPASSDSHQNPNGWGLAVQDYFTPFDQAQLGTNKEDFDLGSGGVVLLDDQPPPFRHLLVLVGKKGVIYVLDRDFMGKFDAGGDSGIGRTVQRIPADPCGLSPVGDVFGTPALFGSTLYINGSPLRNKMNNPISPGMIEPLRAFTIASGKISLTSTSNSPRYFPVKAQSPSVSADGNSGGIVWVVGPGIDIAGVPTTPAVLHAFDASNLANELYTSEQALDAVGKPRDRAGPIVKFTVPTIANGQVFVGCTGEVDVYGKLP